MKCKWMGIAISMLLSMNVGATIVSTDFNDVSYSAMRYQQVGGIGFDTNTWKLNTSDIRIGAGDLVAPVGTGYNVSQSGTAQHAYDGNVYERRQGALLETALSGTVWFSFLVQNGALTDTTGIDFDVSNAPQLDNDPGDPKIVLAGLSLFVSGAGTTDVSSKTALGETALIVGRLTLGGAAETIQVWVNPTLTTESALLAAGADLEETTDLGWDLSSIEQLNLEIYTPDSSTVTSSGMLDSVRLSDEADGFTYVTGVPEPATMGLFGLASLLIMLTRRCRA